MNPSILDIITIIIIICVFSFISIAPWMPTRKKDFLRINKIANLKKWKNFIDLWCGTWSLCIFMALNNKDSQIIWIELSPIFYLISKINVIFSKAKNIKIIYWNALKLNYKNYDIIYAFWIPETINKKIFPKIKEEMKKDSRFLSYCFEIKSDDLDITKHKENEKVFSIYEYRKK